LCSVKIRHRIMLQPDSGESVVQAAAMTKIRIRGSARLKIDPA